MFPFIFSWDLQWSQERQKQCLCKTLEDKQKSIMIFMKVAYWQFLLGQWCLKISTKFKGTERVWNTRKKMCMLSSRRLWNRLPKLGVKHVLCKAVTPDIELESIYCFLSYLNWYVVFCLRRSARRRSQTEKIGSAAQWKSVNGEGSKGYLRLVYYIIYSNTVIKTLWCYGKVITRLSQWKALICFCTLY